MTSNIESTQNHLVYVFLCKISILAKTADESLWLLTGALIGLLSLACCFVQPGRTFLRRLINRTKGIHQPHFHIRLNIESRLDIAAWLLFIDNFNGKTILLKQIWISANKLHLYTDAAGSLGFGAIFESEWFYCSWKELVKDYPIAY